MNHQRLRHPHIVRLKEVRTAQPAAAVAQAVAGGVAACPASLPACRPVCPLSAGLLRTL